MIQDLLNYQEVDAGLRKIETELSGSEERKKAISAKKYLDGVEENVNKLDKRAEDLIAEYERAVAEQKKLNEQKDEFAHALEGVEEASETEYLLKKIDELIGKIKALAGKLNKLSEEMSAITKEYAVIKSTTKAAQAQYAENGKKYNELKASKQAEREELESKLAQLQKKVDGALMEKYLKKRANKMYPIVYEVRGEMCGACNMQLSMLELNKLKNGDVIECDQCGRILYKK